VFNKLKKTFTAMAEQGREMRANPGPADIASLPPGTGAVGGLGAVGPAVVGAYVGMEVTAVRPLDRLGPAPSSLVANAIQDRMRDAGIGDESLPASWSRARTRPESNASAPRGSPRSSSRSSRRRSSR